ncbi:hypothetical protein [Chelativorans sp.]|uniref:hypothetical protein n=1 Tax=Chelativorans sp. TaxID=2203393 RepID=UPI002811037F|nr:hypothetical protein [Chelativorans sp.]
MRYLIAVGLLLAAPKGAQAAYCSEPSAPYCAEQYGEFDDGYEFERCKSEMESYRADVESYLDCLREASEQALSEYNDAVESFNRRARGY